MATRRVKQIYFTRNDDELWNVIDSIPEGEQNHEMRKALRKHFLGIEGFKSPAIPEQIEKKPEPPEAKKEAEDAEEAYKQVNLSGWVTTK